MRIGLGSFLRALPIMRNRRLAVGVGVALPVAKRGLFFSSTTWIRKPSAEISIKIWPLALRNSGSISILLLISSRTISLRVRSLRAFSTSVTEESLMRRCSVSASARFSSPTTLEMLSPPPLIIRVASPEPWPPDRETRRGFWKYAEIPARSPAVVDPNTHISRKKAIMAVTKSA